MTIVIIIVLFIHRNIYVPPFSSHGLLSCCYTHHPPLPLFLSLTFFFINIIASCSLVFSYVVYCILLYLLAGVTLVKEQMVVKKTLDLIARIFDYF